MAAKKMKEVYLYACQFCGTIRCLNFPVHHNLTTGQMHCLACKHNSVPNPISINFKTQKFEVPANDELTQTQNNP